MANEVITITVGGKQYTNGHCSKKSQPGGCQEHNLHCGYPACDRREVVKGIQERSTHHVHRGAESVPCYCAGTSDHQVGQEVHAKESKFECSREIFEEQAFNAYFLSNVTKDLKLSGDIKMMDEFCARDSDGSYVEKTLDAAWWGWCIAIENLDKIIESM